MRAIITTMPPTNSPPTMTPALILARFTEGLGGGVDMLNIPARVVALFEAPMHPGKNNRHEKQGGDGREQQPANDRPAQGSILLGTLSESQRHRNHTDDHRQCGH